MFDALDVVALLLLLALVVLVLTSPFRPVTRERVERFARRQQLPITSDNGPLVIAYLATTRRWRAAAIIAAIVVAMLDAAVRHHGFDLSLAGIFAGWFVGAVIAEWRVERARTADGRRSASLLARRAGDYVPMRLAVLAALVFAAVLVFEVVALVGADSRRWTLLAWLLVTVVIAADLALVSRHVLHRPQPLAAPDLLAADDALRSRSLHVLGGSALAIGGYLLAGSAATAARGGVLWVGQAVPGVFGVVLLPLLGLIAATSPFAVRRPVLAPAGARE